MTEPATPHVLIVQSLLHRDISDELRRGAVKAVERAQATHDTISVPSAFEIPSVIKFAAESMRLGRSSRPIDGFVAIACLIRGETHHFEPIATEATRGLMTLAVDYGLAVGNGILSADDRDKAKARAAVGQGNEGGAAAEACLALMALKTGFGLQP